MSKSRSRLAADWFAKLRSNATTGVVEHEEVAAVQTDVTSQVTSVQNEISTTINSQLSTLTDQLNSIPSVPTNIVTHDGAGNIATTAYGWLHDRFAHATPVEGQGATHDHGVRNNCGNINCNSVINCGYEVFNAGNAQHQVRYWITGYTVSWNCNCACRC